MRAKTVKSNRFARLSPIHDDWLIQNGAATRIFCNVFGMTCNVPNVP